MARSPRREALVDRALDRSLLGYTKAGVVLRGRQSSYPVNARPGALIGRHVAVTGASSGIGKACAAQLHALGAHVHLVVRDETKGEDVAAEIDPSGKRVTVRHCDVGDRDSVGAFADGVLSDEIQLHGLVHNAGALPKERTESSDGHELTMALHVLGPVAMTERLLPAFTDDSRVVFMTSGGMYTQSLPVDDPDYREGTYSGAKAYARSKRTQVDLLPTLVDRWMRHDVAAYAAHPGWVATPGLTESLPRFAAVTRRLLRTPEQGADTASWLVAKTSRRPIGGLWHDRRQRPTTFLGRHRSTEAEREQMWRWVLEATELDSPTAKPAHQGQDHQPTVWTPSGAPSLEALAS